MAEHQTERHCLGGMYFHTCICTWISQNYWSVGEADLSAELHIRQNESWDGMSE